MKAIWDNVRGLDLLAALPFVAGEYSTAGVSLYRQGIGGLGLFDAAEVPS